MQDINLPTAGKGLAWSSQIRPDSRLTRPASIHTHAVCTSSCLVWWKFRAWTSFMCRALPWWMWRNPDLSPFHLPPSPVAPLILHSWWCQAWTRRLLYEAALAILPHQQWPLSGDRVNPLTVSSMARWMFVRGFVNMENMSGQGGNKLCRLLLAWLRVCWGIACYRIIWAVIQASFTWLFWPRQGHSMVS